VLAAASTNDDGSTGRLARVASNIGPKGGGFEYVLSQEQVPGHGFTAQKVFWGEALEGSAQKLLVGDGRVKAIDRAEQFIVHLLKDGPVPVKKINGSGRSSRSQMAHS
jgi:putative DNA primase/helicase